MPCGKRIYTDCTHRVSEDGLLLAKFAHLKPGGAADIGCGCGTVGLNLAAHYDDIFYLIDISGAACSLAKRSADEAGFNVTVVNGDIARFNPQKKLAAVVCNPPYFSTGKKPESEERAAARHEGSLSVDTAAAAARRLLRERGDLFLCYPTCGLAGLFCALYNNDFEPKELCFAANQNGDRPLALVRAVYRGGRGLKLLPDMKYGDEL